MERKPVRTRKNGARKRASPGRTAAGGRHQEILDAALDLFAGQGFQGTSVREIARSVGVNEATLYHYFPSKAEILNAIMDQLLEERAAVFTLGDADPGALDEVLHRITTRALQQYHTERERKFVRLMLIEGPRLAELGKYTFLRLMHDAGQRLGQVFQKLIAAGRMRSGTPRLLALEFLAPIIIYGLHQHGMGGRTKEPIDEAAFARAHVELFACALAPRGAG